MCLASLCCTDGALSGDLRNPGSIGIDTTVCLRKFNRTENVRPIPPEDPDFRGLFRRRNDAESINRALEDTRWLRRAHSLGHRRQLLNLLGYALMINSLAVARHHQPATIAA